MNSNDYPDPWGDENPYLHKILTTAQLEDLPRLNPLISHLLALDSTAWLAGSPGSYKSFIAIDMACSIATGRNYMGLPTKQFPTLYITGEGKTGLYSRVSAWTSHTGRHPTDALWLPEAVDSQHTNWDLMAQAATHHKAKFIVLDTQARMTTGMEENSAMDMGKWVRALDTLQRETGACLLTVHHASKGGEALRGSSVLQGAADTVITSTKAEDGLVTLHSAKQKEIAGLPNMFLRAIPKGDSLVMEEVAA